MVPRLISIRAEVLVLSSPSDFLIASSRKWVVGKSAGLIHHPARRAKPGGCSAARQRGPPPSLVGVAAVSVEWSSEDVAYGSTVF